MSSERRYPPHPLPGVGAIVVGRNGVLLSRRDKDPGKGLWSLPGGAVELGETLVEAVVREVFEETGVRCEVIRLLGTYDLIVRDENSRIEYHYVLLHYLARALNYDLHQEFPGVDVAWFSPDALPVSEMPRPIVDLIHSVRSEILGLMN